MLMSILLFLLYILYKKDNKILIMDSFKNFVDLKFFDEN